MTLFFSFFVWYYSDAIKAVFNIWRNFLYFGVNYFSVTVLLKTFFSPWKKYHSSYGNFFNLWQNFEILVFNLMSRIIGAVARACFIIIGIFFIIIIFILGLIAVLVGFVLPLVLAVGLLFGAWLII